MEPFLILQILFILIVYESTVLILLLKKETHYVYMFIYIPIAIIQLGVFYATKELKKNCDSRNLSNTEKSYRTGCLVWGWLNVITHTWKILKTLHFVFSRFQENYESNRDCLIHSVQSM